MHYTADQLAAAPVNPSTRTFIAGCDDLPLLKRAMQLEKAREPAPRAVRVSQLEFRIDFLAMGADLGRGAVAVSETETPIAPPLPFRGPRLVTPAPAEPVAVVAPPAGDVEPGIIHPLRAQVNSLLLQLGAVNADLERAEWDLVHARVALATNEGTLIAVEGARTLAEAHLRDAEEWASALRDELAASSTMYAIASAAVDVNEATQAAGEAALAGLTSSRETKAHALEAAKAGELQAEGEWLTASEAKEAADAVVVACERAKADAEARCSKHATHVKHVTSLATVFLKAVASGNLSVIAQMVEQLRVDGAPNEDLAAGFVRAASVEPSPPKKNHGANGGKLPSSGGPPILATVHR